MKQSRQIITIEEVKQVVDSFHSMSVTDVHDKKDGFFYGGLYGEKHDIAHTIIIDMNDEKFQDKVIQFKSDQRINEVDCVVASCKIMDKSAGNDLIKIVTVGKLKGKSLKVCKTSVLHLHGEKVEVLPAYEEFTTQTDLDVFLS